MKIIYETLSAFVRYGVVGLISLIVVMPILTSINSTI
jgi:hypothetical protein